MWPGETVVPPKGAPNERVDEAILSEITDGRLPLNTRLIAGRRIRRLTSA